MNIIPKKNKMPTNDQKVGKTFFVTGTDTEVGKTIVSCALLEAFKSMSLSTSVMKPIASGCELSSEGLRNSDALLLQKYCTQEIAYEQLNPFAFKAAIAPHIAAQELGQNIRLAQLVDAFGSIKTMATDITVVEGAGGWLVPINDEHTLADFAKEIDAEVIMVVSVKLGCINHALLTAQAIEAKGLKLAAWVANCASSAQDIDNKTQENIDALAIRLNAPLLGVVPYVIMANNKKLDPREKDEGIIHQASQHFSAIKKII